MIASTTREQRRYGQDGGGGGDDDDDDGDDKRLASRRRSRSSSQVQFDEHNDQVRSTTTTAAAAVAIRESEIERVQVGASETRARCWSTNCLQEERNGANRHRAEQSSDSESLEIRSEKKKKQKKQKEKQSSDWPAYKRQQEAAHDRLDRANKLAASSKGNQVASVVSRPQGLQAQPIDRATTVAPAATSDGHQQSGALASSIGEQKVASDKARRASTGDRGRGAAPAAGVQKRIGLLEALLGDRGKSWFEHKTVILDIQNGKQKQRKSNESGDKSCESEQVNVDLSKKTGQQQSIKSDKKQQQHQVSTATTATTTPNNNNLKYSRLPTFGSVPQKLVANSKLLSQSQQLNLHAPSVPYFSYQGHARNIDITQRKQKTTPTSGGAKSQTLSRDKFRFRRTSDADGSLVSGRLSSSSNSSNNTQTSSSLSASSSDSTTGHQGCSRLLNSYSKSSRKPEKKADTAAAVAGAARKNSTARQVSASTSSLQQQLTASASGAKHLTPPAPSRSAVSRKAPSSSSPLGYSNISNLFPTESVRLWRPASRQSKQTAATEAAAANTNHRTRYKSASLLNLSNTPQAGGKFSPTSLSARPTSQVQASVRSQQAAAAAAATSRKSTLIGRNSVASSTDKMRRQAPPGASSSNQRLATSMGSLNNQNQNQNQSLRRDFGTKLRPMSATGGNYMAPQGSNSTRQRSASSTGGGGGGGAYRLGSAGMSPLIDPDCPVHGDYLGPPPQQQQSAPMYGLGRGRYSSQAIDNEQDEFARTRYGGGGGGHGGASSRGYHSASQPDLYDSNETSAGGHAQYYDDPYNIARPTYGGGGGGGGGTERTSGAYKSSPIYSPVSPIDNNYDNYLNRNQHQQHNQWANEAGQQRYDQKTGARLSGGESGATPYYNNVSRFSMYHQAGDGNIGSSLEPTSEQLRRILGYKPSSVPPKPVHLHPQWAYTRPFIHLQPAGSGFGRSPTPPLGADTENGDYFIDEATGLHQDVPKFAPLNRLQDNQAIRAVDFHPSGEVYAIGSNSRALRICAYPAEHELRHFYPFDSASGGGGGGGAESGTGWQPKPPRVLFKFLQVHRGSIYCVSFNPSGQLLATGSNDQTIHIVKYNSITHNPDGEEFRLTMHNGTIRDLCFIDDSSGNGSSLLLSGGGGDNKIYVTDCDTITPFQSMAGHTQMVMALNHCGGAQFVSGSADKTIRFWDLRSRACTSIVSAPPTNGSPTPASSGSGPGAPVCALRVDPSGRLLASGHTDTTCMLYDIRGGKIIQTFAPHDDEIRAISFSPKSYYLLTGGYDGRLVVSDLQGDLSQPLPSVCVARSQDKIVQAKWHPADFTFVSTSADKSATLWSLPGEIHN